MKDEDLAQEGADKLGGGRVLALGWRGCALDIGSRFTLSVLGG